MKIFVSLVMVMMLMGAWAQPSSATTFPDKGNLLISAPNKEGKVYVYGDSCALDDYLKDIQYCPDQVKYSVGCGLNWPIDVERISPTEAVFQLDMAAVRRGQRAFNFRNGELWSQVSSFKTGENIVVEMSDPNPDSEDGRGGCHYTYIGDLPPGSYVPYKPELCGGGYVKPVAKPAKANTGVAKSGMISGDGAAGVIGNNTQGSAVAKDAQQGVNANTQGITKGNASPVLIEDNKTITSQVAKGHTMKVKGNNNRMDNRAAFMPVEINQVAGCGKGPCDEVVDPRKTNLSPREFERIHKNPDNTSRTDCGTCHNDYKKGKGRYARFEDIAYKNYSHASANERKRMDHELQKELQGKSSSARNKNKGKK